MIDFEMSEGMQNVRTMTHMLAEQAMRPISREYDEREHEKPWDFLNMMWQVSNGNPIGGGVARGEYDGRWGREEGTPRPLGGEPRHVRHRRGALLG